MYVCVCVCVCVFVCGCDNLTMLFPNSKKAKLGIFELFCPKNFAFLKLSLPKFKRKFFLGQKSSKIPNFAFLEFGNNIVKLSHLELNFFNTVNTILTWTASDSWLIKLWLNFVEYFCCCCCCCCCCYDFYYAWLLSFKDHT